MKKLLTLLILAIVMQTSFSQELNDSTNLLKPGARMPKFTATGIDGTPLKSSDLKGKVVLINFFATWCGPCNQELPVVDRDIWAKYKDNKDFVLVIIDREEKAEKVKPWVAGKQWTMPFYLDEKKETYTKFATKFIPRNYLFDKKGKLVLNSMGFRQDEFDVLLKEIDSQLKK
jgi:thiol-disulfide isomerase/thioredoxin